MARLAMPLQQRSDLFEETDGRRSAGRGLGSVSNAARRKKAHREEGWFDRTLHRNLAPQPSNNGKRRTRRRSFLRAGSCGNTRRVGLRHRGMRFVPLVWEDTPFFVKHNLRRNLEF
jgi:hypothetical protein